MLEEEFIQIQGDLPFCYNFIYRDKKYPFNFDLFVGYSKFFLNNRTELQDIKNIQLIDEEAEGNIELSEQVINTFIKFVHRQQLITFTEKYMVKHRNEIVIELLQIHQNNTKFDTKTYEEIISDHFLDHISDIRLLQLNFPIIYRISKRYEEQKKNNKSDNHENEVIEFYFKCLDQFGRQASILFEEVDFEKSSTEFLNRLINKYSTVFDFHYINEGFIKRIYERQN